MFDSIIISSGMNQFTTYRKGNLHTNETRFFFVEQGFNFILKKIIKLPSN